MNMRLILLLLLALMAFNGHASVTASLSASRTSGCVAPCAVFFDATGTTSTATSRPFHEIEYRWSFGDAQAKASWSYGPQSGFSKNGARGAVAAHVYETPGSYTVTLIVYDGTTSANATQSIVVTDPATVYATTATYCIARAALPVAGAGGCPASATAVQASDWCSAVGSNIATTKRLLFNRGETYDCAAKVTITANGPWTIGAYGTGAVPKVSTAQTSGIVFEIGAGAGVARSDGRLMDTEITVASAGNTTQGIKCVGNFDQLTLLRVNVHDIGDGINCYAGVINLSGNTAVWDQHAIVDSVFQNIAGGAGTHGIYHFMTRGSILGTLLDNSVGSEHLVRIEYCDKCVVENNTFSLGANNKETLGLRGVGTDPGDAYYFAFVLPAASPTQYVVISDNKFAVRDFTAIKIGPVDGATHTTIQNVLMERNWAYVPSTPATAVNSLLVLQGADLTVRANILNLSNATRTEFIDMIPASTGMAAGSNIEIYNNTLYSSTDNAGEAALVLAETGVTSGIVVKNNLMYVPAETSNAWVNNGAGTVTASNNSTDSSGSDQMKNTSPDFSSATPSAPADFKIQSSSYGKNAGTGMKTYSDFGLRIWPTATAAWDMGSWSTNVKTRGVACPLAGC